MISLSLPPSLSLARSLALSLSRALSCALSLTLAHSRAGSLCLSVSPVSVYHTFMITSQPAKCQ